MQADTQFKTAIFNSINIEPPEQIIPDGKIHRFGTKNRGWYVFFNDTYAAGAFGDWKTGLSDTWKENRNYSAQEKTAFKKRMDAIFKQREAEQKKRYTKARQACQAIWEKAGTTINHSYLQTKQVQAYGLRQSNKNLLIPVRINKEITSLQTITEDGNKLFHAGGEIKGGYHVIGKPDSKPILIGEGYATLASAYHATGYCSVVAFNAGNLKAVSLTIRKNFPDKKIIILADNDQWTEGNPGIQKAREAAKTIGALIAIPDFKDTSSKPTDFNDLHCLEGLEAVKQQIETALNTEPETHNKSPEETVQSQPDDKLKEVEEILNNAIEKLKGGDFGAHWEPCVIQAASHIKQNDLPLFMRKRKEIKDCGQDAKTGEWEKVIGSQNDGEETTKDEEVVKSDTAYHETVNAVDVLSEIEALINRHMVLPAGALPAICLWVVSTYVQDAFRVFPKLAVISPEKRCGKSTLLDILSGLCSRSLLASNITPSAIFRSVDLWKPTLIIDEADTFLSGRNDDLIGIINSGHTRTTAYVIRTVGDEHPPKKFSTWSPMAFASIKGIAGTVMDRSIIIQLRRRMAGETVQRLSTDFKENNEALRQKLTRWADDNFKALKSNQVEPPEIPNDRAIDNWLPLFTIARAIGGDWPGKIESSYYTLNITQEEETAAVMLLRDIKDIFEDKKWVKTFSSDLVAELIKLDERPWCEWKRGKPMTQNSLAKILSSFGVHSKQTRIGADKKRGFELSQFNDAFSRYLPNTGIQSGTVVQPNNGGAYSDIQSGTKAAGVPLEKPLKPKQDGVCTTVPLQNTAMGKEARKEFEI